MYFRVVQSDVCVSTICKAIEEANQEFTDGESSEYDESEDEERIEPEAGAED